MGNSAYIEEQLKRIDSAIRKATRARNTALEIQQFSSESKKPETAGKDDFAEDTLKVFDTSYSQGQIETLRLGLNDLKKKLIEIKIANDELLFEGGFLFCIDQIIDDIFLSNTLCLLQANDNNTKSIMDDTIEKLNELRVQVAAKS